MRIVRVGQMSYTILVYDCLGRVNMLDKKHGSPAIFVHGRAGSYISAGGRTASISSQTYNQ